MQKNNQFHSDGYFQVYGCRIWLVNRHIKNDAIYIWSIFKIFIKLEIDRELLCKFCSFFLKPFIQIGYPELVKPLLELGASPNTYYYNTSALRQSLEGGITLHSIFK